MTTIVYNDVVLRDCETKVFEQDIRYDPSDTDVLYSKFRIRVASTVVAIRNVTGQNQFGIDTSRGTTIAQKQHDIQGKLAEPRKDFWMVIDGCVQDERHGDGNVVAPPIDQTLLLACGKAYDEILSSPNTEAETITRTELFMDPHPFNTSDADTRLYGEADTPISKVNVLDCENGPKPQHVSVTQIIGGRSLRVEFEIIVCRRICSEDFADSLPAAYGGSIGADNRVLSNRWHLDETKDENWKTTRVLQGTLRVAHSSFWAQAMRYLCVPGLLKGYRRFGSAFMSDPTDLVLKYRIEDRQEHAAPPYPAVSWSGHHVESASGPNGMRKGGQVQLTLTGPIGVDKTQLIGAAVKIAAVKLPGLLPPRDEDGNVIRFDSILENAAIIDVLDQPTIELRVQIRYTNEQEGLTALGLRVENMGNPLPNSGQYAIDGYDPRVWPVPLPYDSVTPAGIFNCYLQHPCSIWHGMPGGQYPRSGPPYPRDGDESENSESEDEDDRPENKESGDSDAVVYDVDHVIPEDVTDIAGDSSIYNFPYSFVELENRYEINEGWSALPLATTDPNAPKHSLLLQLHAPTAIRILTMTATRSGRPAIIPAMTKQLTDHNGNREVLAKRIITAKAPTLMANGAGREFETQIQFVYLLEKAPPDDGKLRIGSSPLDSFSPNRNWLDLATLEDSSGHLQWDGNTVTYPPAPA